MARIDEQDAGAGIVGERQRAMIGQPGRPIALQIPVLGLPQQLGRPDAEGIGPSIGIGPDRPTIEAPFAGADEAPSIRVKEHGRAASLEVDQLPAGVGFPEADAVPAGGQQPAVGADVRRFHAADVSPLVAVAEHLRVERAAFGARGDLPDAELRARRPG